MRNLLKIGKILLLILLVIIALILILESTSPVNEVKFGVTFSPRYAKYLKLDWQQAFIKILGETGIENLRLVTYWEDIESQPDHFDFSETDFMLDEAAKREAKAILVVGQRQPRWPECHIPVWAKNLNISERQEKVLEFIEKTIERYNEHSAIWAWQVENEPFLPFFGEGCDPPDQNFLKTEVDLVRKISPKTIIMTDSGELGFWTISMELSDIFGTTLYRRVYNDFFGYTTYPLPPSFYRLKSDLVRKIFAPDNKKTIIVELQAEPWLAGGEFKSADQQAALFTVEQFKNYVNFAKKTGFDEVYLWGVEWWYFMANHGHPEYLDYAKTLFK